MEGNYFFVERDIYVCVCVWTENVEGCNFENYVK